ncbi:MAG: SRPBCC domain-containing protein [Anaerolineae bacterium]|nr:SRPBCC domain-containing protein [Anaerolineae bacterium]
MKELCTAIEINAVPERVWQILTDTDKFPDWNPFIRSCKGKLAQGETVEVVLGEGKTMTFRPTIVEVTPNRTLRWLGKLFVGGLFDGEHIFEIEPMDAHRVRFIQREKFSGLLIPVFNLESTEQGFNAMNRALKQRAEAV